MLNLVWVMSVPKVWFHLINISNKINSHFKTNKDGKVQPLNEMFFINCLALKNPH